MAGLWEGGQSLGRARSSWPPQVIHEPPRLLRACGTRPAWEAPAPLRPGGQTLLPGRWLAGSDLRPQPDPLAFSTAAGKWDP